ncbi:hypothetical protein [Bowmanella sp. JS7-9]|uniref:Uncharacterized protein n=1 Tax=Pseudobowmanella zhangzhouensis TaxID=1537679 RepID=A0ABW1XI34_9ALTE|nr:hypothetical protein [Bowmanella sp. JS7-9]TBX27567.1 hypothetical protein TK45_00015 [Bowmanella sp. JS7-9]
MQESSNEGGIVFVGVAHKRVWNPFEQRQLACGAGDKARDLIMSIANIEEIDEHAVHVGKKSKRVKLEGTLSVKVYKVINFEFVVCRLIVEEILVDSL